MRKAVWFILALGLVAFAASAGGQKEAAAELTGTISVAGSSTVYPITVAVAEDFSKMHPRIEIPVQSTGTGGGFTNFFVPGKADINNASRPIKSSEADKCRENGFEAIEFQVATDGITIVVSPEATWIDEITVEQLAMIWRPQNPARTWSDVNPGWPNAKIELYGPTSASGTFEFFTEAIMKKAGASRSDYQGTEQDNTIVQAVSGSKYAMGYFGMAYYLENKDRVKALKVGGVAPSIETARTYTYKPLSRPIFIYVNSNSLERPEMKQFVRFYIEQTSTDLISEIGYVPVTDAVMKENLARFDMLVSGTK